MPNDVFCKRIMKRPQISQQAGKLFAERVESRGYTKNLIAGFLVNTLQGSVSGNSIITPFNILLLHPPFDSNKQLASTTLSSQKYFNSQNLQQCHLKLV